ncbi:transposase [Microbacterium paludicola]|uniref:transposase n=1 Tax=Microbacterium paludicola TaxID=300019 RepID=UPI0011A5938D|nr:transposase [Microbacterium paludicola]
MAADADGTIDDIAAELCALPPGEFTDARNAKAKQIEDAALAAEVRAIRKPLLAAWAVNLFARERADELGEALDLARELREAQDDMDAAALRTLNRQRRALIRQLTAAAGELATARGEKITQATADAVSQTLNAAMFDAHAATAVASRRLVRPLEASGADPAEIAEAVAGHLDAEVPPPTARPPDELKARRVLKEARNALRSAEKDLAGAERAHDAAERAWSDGAERADELDERVATLEKELAAVRKEATALKKERAATSAERLDTQERVEAAQEAVAAAREALDEAESAVHR